MGSQPRAQSAQLRPLPFSLSFQVRAEKANGQTSAYVRVYEFEEQTPFGHFLSKGIDNYLGTVLIG